jgi:uncharacterized membrane protein YdjX (TVP38/TMEM64 family)
MKQRRYDVRRVAVLLALVAAAVAATRSDATHRVIIDVLRAAERLIREHPQGGPVIFLVLAILSAMLAFFSSAVIVPIGVFVWGRAMTFALLWVGWTVGGAAGYWLSRTLGRRLARWLVPDAPVARYEAFVARAPWPQILLFQVALPSEIPSYVLGLVRYPFVRYLAAVTLAELPFAVTAVYLGEAFVNKQALALGAVAVLALAVSATAWHAFHDRVERSSAAGARDPHAGEQGLDGS